MLHMDYFDRNGQKWSIEKGDWLGHQGDNPPAKDSHKKILSTQLGLIILVLVAVITCLISLT